jgi:competence protein ComEC
LIARFKPLEASLRAPRGAVFVMALSGSFLILLTVLPFIPGRSTEVRFPDVGQGDCALITFSSGQTVLIDGGGTRDNRFDMGRRVLAPYLWNRGIRALDLVVLSHPHPDHMNGLLFILRKFPVAEVWEAGLDVDLPGHDEFKRILVEKNIPLRIVSADDPPILLGDTELRILHPRRAFEAPDRQTYAAENNRSLVVEVRSEGKAFVFTGDIGTAAEKDIVRTVTDLKTDLLKIPHHGSKSSSSEAFVNALRPEIGVITVGKGNQYRHPSEEVIMRYERIGTRICRTDSDGAVTVRIRRNRLEVIAWNDLLLDRIGLRDRDAWGSTEWANGSRLLIRTMAF